MQSFTSFSALITKALTLHAWVSVCLFYFIYYVANKADWWDSIDITDCPETSSQILKESDGVLQTES